MAFDIGSMLGSVGSAVVGAISSGVQNSKNREYDSAKTRYQNEYNTSEREAAQAYGTSERLASQEYNTQMWNLQNQYNSPVAQLGRAASAGVNPNSVFGSNGVSGLPSSAPTSSPMSSSGMSSGSGGVPQQFDIGSILETGLNATFNNLLTIEQAKNQKIQNKFEAEKQRLSVSQIKETINGIVQKSNLDKEQANQLKVLTPILKGKGEMEIKEIWSALQLNIAQVYKASQDIKESESRVGVNESQVALNESQTELNKSEKNLTDEKTRAQVFENVVNHAVAALAQKGIIVGKGDWAALLSFATSGEQNIADVLSDVFSGLAGGITKGIIGAAGKTFQSGIGYGQELVEKYSPYTTFVKPQNWPLLWLFRYLSAVNP